MSNPTDDRELIERLERDIERLRADAGRAAHFGTPSIQNSQRWNGGFAADLEQAIERIKTLGAAAERSTTCFECGGELHGPYCPACNSQLQRVAADWRKLYETLGTTLVAAIRLAKEARGAFRPDYRHVKRGTAYQSLGSGTLQTDKPLIDGVVLKAYVDIEGRWWFRTPAEFHDGRFERIEEPANG